MVEMQTDIWSAGALDTAAGRNRAVVRPDTLPRGGPTVGQGDALAQFIRQSQPWSRERVALPRRVRCLVWLLVTLQLIWAVWLSTLLTGALCTGRLCAVATLGGQVTLLLACSLVSLAGLGGVAVVTRGLSATDGRESAGLTVSVAAGGVALLGVLAVACVLAVVLLAFAVLFGTMTAT